MASAHWLEHKIVYIGLGAPRVRNIVSTDKISLIHTTIHKGVYYLYCSHRLQNLLHTTIHKGVYYLYCSHRLQNLLHTTIHKGVYYLYCSHRLQNAIFSMLASMELCNLSLALRTEGFTSKELTLLRFTSYTGYTSNLITMSEISQIFLYI